MVFEVIWVGAGSLVDDKSNFLTGLVRRFLFFFCRFGVGSLWRGLMAAMLWSRSAMLKAQSLNHRMSVKV
jgi:hypothetical protein